MSQHQLAYAIFVTKQTNHVNYRVLLFNQNGHDKCSHE